MSSVLPTEDEFADLIPAAGSVTWRYAGDVRLLGGAGYALALQTAHPTVGAGVAQFSAFATDPWGRLLRTLDYVNGTIYGGPKLAGAIGKRVREVHRTIKGLNKDGERYHALEPEAFACVHATLAASIYQTGRRFGNTMTPSEREVFWQEWRKLGRLVGVRDRDLPETWQEFEIYFDRTVRDTLQDHPTVHEVFDLLDAPSAPPVPGLPEGVWNVIRKPASAQVKLISIGMMPPLLRDRFGMEWTSGHELRFRALAAASRASGPLLIPQLREFGPVYVKARMKQLRRGDVAATPPPAREVALT